MNRAIDMQVEPKIILDAQDIDKVVEGPDGALTILQPTRLSIRSGDSVAIIGPSGSGKTTLLGLLAGLDLPSSGKIRFMDQELTELDEDDRAALRSQSVGFVFQSFHLLSSLTALENVMLPLELYGESNPEQRAREVLESVGLGERALHYPNQLSGGEKQRVAIARAYARRPEILFADEPTGNLDANTGSAVTDLLFELNQQQGTALLLVTHDERLASRCARVIRLEAGQATEMPQTEPAPVAEASG